MSEGFKEHVKIEREVQINFAVFDILTSLYEQYKSDMSDYERSNVDGELSRLKEDKSQSFGIYACLRGLGDDKKRGEMFPRTDVYRDFVNAAASAIKEEIPEMEHDMRNRLLTPIE